MKFNYELIRNEAIAKHAILDPASMGNFSLPKSLPGASKSPIVQQAKINQSAKTQQPQQPAPIQMPAKPQIKLGQMAANPMPMPINNSVMSAPKPMQPSPAEVQARKRKILLSMLAAGALTGIGGAGAYAYANRNPGYKTNIDNVKMQINRPVPMNPNVMSSPE